MSKKRERKVVVTTDKDRRGVFFGTLKTWKPHEQTCVLTNARMCVYWSQSTKGVLGLAANGPQAGSRITPSIPSIELNGVTSVMDATDIAVDQWEKGVWS